MMLMIKFVNKDGDGGYLIPVGIVTEERVVELAKIGFYPDGDSKILLSRFSIFSDQRD